MRSRRASSHPLRDLAKLVRDLFEMDLAMTRMAIARFAPGAERFFSAPALFVLRFLDADPD
ncbi:MAG TPA: hypothetical protein VEJ18_00010 [Planctomycetota bacterium]|nr:hypothetical protein [Planctomycetota bacterium]